MVRLAAYEDLGDMRGRLTTGFEAVTLQGRFLAALGPEQRPVAHRLLRAFSETAAAISRHEEAFDRADRQGGLLRHLRPAEHFTALRDFRALGEELMGMEQTAGTALVDSVKREMADRASGIVNGPVIPDKSAGIKSAGRPAVQKL